MRDEEFKLGMKVKFPEGLETTPHDHFEGEATVVKLPIGWSHLEVDRGGDVGGGGHILPQGYKAWNISSDGRKYLIKASQNVWKGKRREKKKTAEM